MSALKCGDSVQIQNQYGNHPKKWTNTGVVAEALPNRQYHVVVDGSRRITLRNRKFLRKIEPIARKNNYDPGISQPQMEASMPDALSKSTQEKAMPHSMPSDNCVEQPDVDQSHNDDPIVIPPLNIDIPVIQEPDEISLPRRSTRARTKTNFFTPKLSGKSHV